MSYPPADHPGDRWIRHWIVRHLRQLREQLGISRAELADELWLTVRAVETWEDENDPNPHIGTLQRYARALDHRLDLRLTGIPGFWHQPPTLLGLQPADADTAVRASLAAALVAARQGSGITLTLAGRAMSRTRHAAARMEQRTANPLLAARQRYARVLGGRIVVQVVPDPPIDLVKVDHVHAGLLPFGSLTTAEQVALLQRHGHDADEPQRTRLSRWGISHTTLKKVERLAGLAVAA